MNYYGWFDSRLQKPTWNHQVFHLWFSNEKQFGKLRLVIWSESKWVHLWKSKERRSGEWKILWKWTVLLKVDGPASRRSSLIDPPSIMKPSTFIRLWPPTHFREPSSFILYGPLFYMDCSFLGLWTVHFRTVRPSTFTLTDFWNSLSGIHTFCDRESETHFSWVIIYD